jgi:hypothetical protein
MAHQVKEIQEIHRNMLRIASVHDSHIHHYRQINFEKFTALSTPSTSSLFGLEGMSRPSSRGDFRASATTSIFGLEGVSRPSSRAESHPLSREAGSRPISSTMGINFKET